MSEIICRSISNGREFEVSTDYFRSLHALRNECNSYTQSEARYTELLTEHDKQIETELLDKVEEKFIELDSRVKEVREDGVCFFTIENVLKVIDEMKVEIEKLKGA